MASRRAAGLPDVTEWLARADALALLNGGRGPQMHIHLACAVVSLDDDEVARARVIALRGDLTVQGSHESDAAVRQDVLALVTAPPHQTR